MHNKHELSYWCRIHEYDMNVHFKQQFSPIVLMRHGVLLISFTPKPRIQNANVSQRTGIEKNTSMKCEKGVQKLHGSEAGW